MDTPTGEPTLHDLAQRVPEHYIKERGSYTSDQTLRGLTDRLDALEVRSHRLDELEAENQRLHAAVLALQMTQRDSSEPAPARISAGTMEQLSRRWVLRRAVQVGAASVAAGALLQRQAPTVQAADGVFDNVYATSVAAIRSSPGGSILAQNQSNDDTTIVALNGGSGSAFYGEIGSTVSAAINGRNNNGTAIHGIGRAGIVGVSSATGYEGVYGQHLGTYGFGVVGDGTGAGAGVLGRNGAGEGVRGEGKVGLYGKSTTSGGYGGQFEGGKAQLRLVPRGTPGKPTSGTHAKGEIYLDSAGTLFICTVGGTPGTWRKVSTTAD